MQGKVCGKKRHTKTEIRSEISELICGRIAAGENYNLTRDTLADAVFLYTVNVLLTLFVQWSFFPRRLRLIHLPVLRWNSLIISETSKRII